MFNSHYGEGLGGEKEGTQKHAGIWMREGRKCSVSHFLFNSRTVRLRASSFVSYAGKVICSGLN